MIHRLLFFLFLTYPIVANAQTVTNQVDPSIVREIGERFANEYHKGGMSSVSGDIQNCYDATTFQKTETNEIAVSACILYDISSIQLDNGVRHAFVARGMNDPGPATKYLSDKAFEERLSIYGPIPFADGSLQEIIQYYGSGPEQIMNIVSNSN